MAAWDKYAYTPGLVFESPFSAYVLICRPGRELKYAEQHNEELDPLAAEFATHGAEYSYTNPDTQNLDRAAEIRGHFLNLDEFADEKNWSDEERELAAKRLLWACEKYPADIHLWSKPKVAAPWPTYAKTHHNQVPVLAETLGLVEQALVYERQNQARPSVVEKLTEVLDRQREDATAEESLTAA